MTTGPAFEPALLAHRNLRDCGQVEPGEQGERLAARLRDEGDSSSDGDGQSGEYGDGVECSQC